MVAPHSHLLHYSSAAFPTLAGQPNCICVLLEIFSGWFESSALVHLQGYPAFLHANFCCYVCVWMLAGHRRELASCTNLELLDPLGHSSWAPGNCVSFNVRPPMMHQPCCTCLHRNTCCHSISINLWSLFSCNNNTAIYMKSLHQPCTMSHVDMFNHSSTTFYT